MTAFGSTKLYNQQPDIQIPRSTFDLSRNHKTTMDGSKLIPLFLEEVLPGDTMSLDDSIFARIATPIVPIMDDIFFKMHYFFVPSRLDWVNSAEFFGERVVLPDGTSGPEKFIPQIVAPNVTGFTENSNYDYMGIPTKIPKLSINALPLRGLRRVVYEWYRDQNLNIWLDGLATGDGPDNVDLYDELFVRNANQDYFTACLPWPQKGPAVQLALASKYPVTLVPHTESTNPMLVKNATTGALNGTSTVGNNATGQLLSNANTAVIDPNGRYELDLTDNVGLTVNSIRFAFQIQKLYEKDARGGTRYIELILAHFGVQNPDFRLQRPEYLGMSKRQVNFTSVPQTNSTDETSPQGNLAAYGTMSGVSNGFTTSFTEHGYVIGIGFFYQHNSYQQGLSRLWSRRSRFDFYWPTLAHLGEQAVLNKELYAQGPDAINPATSIPYDEEAFGYIPRWDEYRQGKNYVTGRMRSNATGTLDLWHLANKYSTKPNLNTAFIAEQLETNLNRAIATPEEPQFIVDAYFKVSATRPMPMFSVPGLVDHF